MKTLRVLFLVLILVRFIPLFAQKDDSTMDKLQATTWWNGPLPKWVSYIKFSKTKCMFTTKYEGELGTRTYNPNSYYLSNTIDTIFDKSKIGKISNGKYIIDGCVKEIIKLDEKDFWYRVIYPTDITRGAGFVIKWTAVPNEGIPWKEE